MIRHPSAPLGVFPPTANITSFGRYSRLACITYASRTPHHFIVLVARFPANCRWDAHAHTRKSIGKFT
jgi:hypothetical protein